jgi:hypothetical protein
LLTDIVIPPLFAVDHFLLRGSDHRALIADIRLTS